MSAPKRTDTEVMRDRAIVAELYVMRFPLVEILRRINEGKPKERQISFSQLQKDLLVIRREWQARKRETIDVYLNEILDVLDITHREAYAEWIRSKLDHTRKQQKAVTEPSKGKDNKKSKSTVRNEASLMTEGQTGDPRYLQIVLQAIERKCKLLGLDAPTKLEGPNGEALQLAVNVVITDRRMDEKTGEK